MGHAEEQGRQWGMMAQSSAQSRKGWFPSVENHILFYSQRGGEAKYLNVKESHRCPAYSSIHLLNEKAG